MSTVSKYCDTRQQAEQHQILLGNRYYNVRLVWAPYFEAGVYIWHVSYYPRVAPHF